MFIIALFSIQADISHEHVNRISPLTQFEVLKGLGRFWRAPRVQPQRQSAPLRRLFALQPHYQGPLARLPPAQATDSP